MAQKTVASAKPKVFSRKQHWAPKEIQSRAGEKREGVRAEPRLYVSDYLPILTQSSQGYRDQVNRMKAMKGKDGSPADEAMYVLA
jgi:hypothetical protein